MLCNYSESSAWFHFRTSGLCHVCILVFPQVALARLVQPVQHPTFFFFIASGCVLLRILGGLILAMPTTCIIRQRRTTYGSANNVRFHNLPSEPQCKAVWLRAINRDGFNGMDIQSGDSWSRLLQADVLPRVWIRVLPGHRLLRHRRHRLDRSGTSMAVIVYHSCTTQSPTANSALADDAVV